MKFLFAILFLLISLPHASAGALPDDKRAWEAISNPLIMKVNERRFVSLPLSARASNPHRYWSSDFWMKSRGGINYRWNAKKKVGHNLRSPSKEEALLMNTEELASLAATEKLDLLAGDYTYSLKKEIAKYADPKAPSWEGICNGWSEAATHHNEPIPVTLKNADGVEIPFGSSDIKALLSWYYFRKSADDYSRIGGRCYDEKGVIETCKNDLNAGAFHLVLTNRIGLEGRSFIADIDRGNEVWNHTAYDYKSTVTKERRGRWGSARGTKKVIRVKTVVRYTFVQKRNMWEPVLGTEFQKFSTRKYEYDLELDAAGNIIGGEWISKERPDFMWSSAPTTEFTGNMARLADLLAAQPQY